MHPDARLHFEREERRRRRTSQTGKMAFSSVDDG